MTQFSSSDGKDLLWEVGSILKEESSIGAEAVTAKLLNAVLLYAFARGLPPTAEDGAKLTSMFMLLVYSLIKDDLSPKCDGPSTQSSGRLG